MIRSESKATIQQYALLAMTLMACSSGSGASASAQSSIATGGSTAPTAASGGSLSLGGNRTSGGTASVSMASGGSASGVGGSTGTGIEPGLTGGAKTTGGAQTSGGSRAVGGSFAMGGSSHPTSASAIGGTAVAIGGSTSSGGTLVTGGAKATGGIQATGGANATGGISSMGGGKSTGGVSAIGGVSATGGTLATGGKSNVNTSTARTKCSVYIAGDSTVSTYTLTSSPKDQAGWGQMLQQYYDSKYVTVVDKAVGGMTARHFIQAGNLDAILTALKPGDYFLVQFGTNDSNTTATYTINGVSYPYFADANTDFKTYLQQYIDGAAAKGATPVLVTPPPRNSAYCNGGRSMAGYAQAMLDLGKADDVAVVDLSIKAWTYLSAICPKPTDGSSENFFKVNSDNSIDSTHFQENGATKLAEFVADGIGEAGLSLDASRVQKH